MPTPIVEPTPSIVRSKIPRTRRSSDWPNCTTFRLSVARNLTWLLLLLTCTYPHRKPLINVQHQELSGQVTKGGTSAPAQCPTTMFPFGISWAHSFQRQQLNLSDCGRLSCPLQEDPGALECLEK
ncbi:hypothetical protein E2C01_023293 [Portunus trituberculatus]|uniref:Uncharacterized protein n=1 Tax=Portunus trituberculatus TaxID=210409 RepID=A0A5B7E9E6_PORTR|nr:hypothetical protein [Portunus trituberculatus]